MLRVRVCWGVAEGRRVLGKLGRRAMLWRWWWVREEREEMAWRVEVIDRVWSWSIVGVGEWCTVFL